MQTLELRGIDLLQVRLVMPLVTCLCNTPSLQIVDPNPSIASKPSEPSQRL